MAMTLRLTDEQDAALTRLANAQGISKNEAAARAIERQLSETERERDFVAALDDTLARYPSTIKRLGE
ncbi:MULTISPECIES: CopG family transcriptional regulator [unclassified Aeromicrobium]|uniref:CopG family transcriptional regulator n=1 Tax=unclassified Aeromicrobium TaxID=2633570 RepID=UPI00288AFABA|nr:MULTISPECIES: CopG family transcriptional regulator [unclassified Aeromicrobium]